MARSLSPRRVNNPEPVRLGVDVGAILDSHAFGSAVERALESDAMNDRAIVLNGNQRSRCQPEGGEERATKH